MGHGPGRGYTLNLPVWPGPAANDALYARLMAEKVLPRLDTFRPEAIVVSAGFDAHTDDPLAQINLSDDAYTTITRQIALIADAHCDGRIVSLLEGGYDLSALARSVVRHVSALY